jgi:uncharacterized protein YidB (DUF937 family)
MANKMPSMLALLGLLAVAGYQNRDKISEALKGLKADGPTQVPKGEGGGLLSGLGGLLGAAAGGGGLTGGLSDLLNSFKTSGQAEVADSWVRPGVPTQGLTPSQVEQALGADNLEELSKRTGLERDELLKRLSTAIPENVDRLTPNGNFPTEEAARQHFAGVE